MRIQRSWVLCVLTIIALVIAVHEARAQSYPYQGPPPAVGSYPGIPPQMQPGMPGPAADGASFAPQLRTRGARTVAPWAAQFLRRRRPPAGYGTATCHRRALTGMHRLATTIPRRAQRHSSLPLLPPRR